MNRQYPYSDEFMVWSEADNRYYITEAALMSAGVNLRARLSVNLAVDTTSVINGLIRRVSEIIYNFIHKHSNNPRAQDELIKKNAFARPIIYRALVDEALYVIKNGDLSLSIDPGIRALAIDENAKCELNTELEDVRISLLYAGGGCYGYT